MSWDKVHDHYAKQDWSNIPSLFASGALSFFSKSGKILEIGAGIGQDSRFFYSKGYEVCSTDFAPEVIEMNRKRSSQELENGKYNIQLLDVTKNFPYSSEEFDVVYAHLSLHYFSLKKTEEIIQEISRILKKGGILAILLNSTSDPEYNTREKIEEDYFMFGQISKRYFSVHSTKDLFGKLFDPLLLDDNGETYKDREKGIHNLIRFIGRKNM